MIPTGVLTLDEVLPVELVEPVAETALAERVAELFAVELVELLLCCCNWLSKSPPPW